MCFWQYSSKSRWAHPNSHDAACLNRPQPERLSPFDECRGCRSRIEPHLDDALGRQPLEQLFTNFGGDIDSCQVDHSREIQHSWVRPLSFNLVVRRRDRNRLIARFGERAQRLVPKLSPIGGGANDCNGLH